MSEASTCPGVDELDAYAARDLDDAAGGSVRAHLEACAACRARLDDIEANLALAADLEGEWPALPAEVPLDLPGYRVLQELGRGRHGARLRGRAGGPARARRGEGAAPIDPRRARRRAPATGDTRPGAAGPPGNRGRARRGTGAGRTALPRDGARRRRSAHRLRRAAGSVDPRARRALPAGVRRARARAPARRHPPRPEAVERARRRRGAAEGARLRLGEAARDRGGRRLALRVGRRARGEGHAPLHEPGAGPRPMRVASTCGATCTPWASCSTSS